MTTEVASLKVVFTGDDSQLKGTIAGVKSTLQSTGGQLSNVGHQIGTGIMQGIGVGVGLGIAGVTAQIASLGPAMLSSAATFDNSFRNVNAILQLTNDELEGVKDQVLALGANSVAGPQMVASAYYEIVSAVADTSVHMDLLSQSIRTAEAGQADLIGTTNTMVSIMNAYRLSAADAAKVSDTLTQTVAMGVGSMDQFGQAFAGITGLGATLNVSLDELGAELAFITTRGFSASEAATQLSSAMTAFINPSDKMKKALKEMGYESGSALIKAEGLAGAMEMLSTAMGGNVDSIADLLGRKEALQAFLAITGDGFEDFFGKFEGGVEGATEAARNMQLESTTQQWELFKSKIEAVGIALGDKFLPVANQAIDALMLLADVGAELLGIDLEFDVSGEAPDLEAEANRIIGPVEPIEVAQGVEVTFAQGDIAWDIWERDFKDKMSWTEFSAQYYDALRAAGIPNARQTPAGFTFSVDLGVDTVAEPGSVTSLERMNEALYGTGRATESIEPSKVELLATKLDELFAKEGLTTDFAFAFGLIGPALQEANTQLDNMTVTPGEAITAFNDLKEAIGDFKTDVSEIELPDFGETIQNMATEAEKGWLKFQIDAAEAINSVIGSVNNLGGDVLDKLGIGFDIEEIDVSAQEARLAELNMEVPVTPVIEDAGIDDLLANFSGEPVTITVTADGLSEIAENVGALEEITGEPLNIMVGEDSYTSVTDFNTALMAGTYDSVAEPLNVTISQNSIAQVSQFGTDFDWATRNRIPVVTIDSNLPGFAYDLNNTIRDRVMNVMLRIMEGNAFDIPGFAAGGDVKAGEPILVGEKGPEIFTPDSSGAIIPNSDLVAMSHSSMAGGGSSGPTFNGDIHVYGVQDPEAFYDRMVEIGAGRANSGFVMGNG